jgi:lysophospholipase L1-like esterase
MKIATKLLLGLCLGLSWPVRAPAQLVPDFHPPKARCCLSRYAAQFADELRDWNQLGRYYDDDLRLEKMPEVKGRVVFLGDSITDGWDLAKDFPGKPYVNRGISGQTTPQMLVRLYPDVIRLHPAAMVILAGTNDIAGNTGPETLETMENNFRAICELAESRGIKIILCLLTPVSDYTKSKQTEHRPPTDIVRFNQWLQSLAPDLHAAIADYYSALVDDKAMLREGYSEDGLHPNARGYEIMAPIAESAIEKALQ